MNNYQTNRGNHRILRITYRPHLLTELQIKHRINVKQKKKHIDVWTININYY